MMTSGPGAAAGPRGSAVRRRCASSAGMVVFGVALLLTTFRLVRMVGELFAVLDKVTL